LNQPVKIFPFALVFFVLERGFRFNGGIGEPIQVSQLEAPIAIDVILQGRLGKSGELHAAIGGWDPLYGMRGTAQVKL
jgi:hypothetical protein